MHGVEAEGRYFDGSLDRINIEGPWPKPTLKQDRVVERLVNALYNPAKSLNGRARRGTPVQVQHFACHCRTINQRDAGYTLVLGGPDERERNVTLGAIRRGFRRRTQRGRVAGARPLIIANACGSAKIDKETRQSFPHWFLSNRFRGFVGTETDVPDDVAADFAARLYQELFDKKPLGEAVVMARRRLMSERGSPLGLLYVLYGNPALAIETSRQRRIKATSKVARTATECQPKYSVRFYASEDYLINDNVPLRTSSSSSASRDQVLAFTDREVVRAAAMLVAWNDPHRARTFLLRMDELAPDPADRTLTARFALRVGLPDTAVFVARRMGRDGLVLPEAGWPIAAEPPDGPVDAVGGTRPDPPGKQLRHRRGQSVRRARADAAHAVHRAGGGEADRHRHLAGHPDVRSRSQHAPRHRLPARDAGPLRQFAAARGRRLQRRAASRR